MCPFTVKIYNENYKIFPMVVKLKIVQFVCNFIKSKALSTVKIIIISFAFVSELCLHKQMHK